jgi:hypothetical protein
MILPSLSSDCKNSSNSVILRVNFSDADQLITNVYLFPAEIEFVPQLKVRLGVKNQ